MLATKVCSRCKSKESEEWWKCCHVHVSEHDADVLCLKCKNELHPVCCALNADGYGLQELCGYVKDHAGRHTWETWVPPLDDPAPEADEVQESFIEKNTRSPKEKS